MIVLKTNVNFKTGVRACGRDFRDPNYITAALYQNMKEGWEVAVVLDVDDSSEFEKMEGVEILPSLSAVAKVLNQITVVELPPQYTIISEGLMVEAIRQKNIKLNSFPNGTSTAKILETLYEVHGIVGIDKILPPTKRTITPELIEQTLMEHPKINKVENKSKVSHLQKVSSWLSSDIQQPV